MKKEIIKLIVIYIILYLGISFLIWDFNPKNWGIWFRLIHLYGGIFTYLLLKMNED